MNKSCEKKTTAHSQNMLHVDVLYNIKRKKFCWIIAIFKECLIKNRNSHCLYRYQVTLNCFGLIFVFK